VNQLPRLEIVPVPGLILHEDVESYRVDKIVKRLRVEDRLANPPIVGRNRNHRRLIVLDGASRVTAARRLGFPHMLVQVVPYPSPEIGLEPWHHLLVGVSLGELEERAGRIAGVVLERMPWPRAEEALDRRRILAAFRSPRRPATALRLAQPRKTGLRPIRELTRLYATDPGLHRISEEEAAFPREWLGEEHVLVMFPRFRQSDILRFALRLEDRLPMGITRHSVPNRALRVHYPTRELRSRRPLAEKRKRLEQFLEARWETGRIRTYPESTTLYDE